MISINWGLLILEVNKKYNLIVENKEELVSNLIEVGYELLPFPVRLVISKDKFEKLLRSNANLVWSTYQSMKK